MRLTLYNAYCQLCFWNCQLSNAEYYDISWPAKCWENVLQKQQSQCKPLPHWCSHPGRLSWAKENLTVDFWMLDSPCAESNYHTWGSQPPTLPTLQHHPWRIFSKQWYFVILSNKKEFSIAPLMSEWSWKKSWASENPGTAVQAKPQTPGFEMGTWFDENKEGF